MGSAWLTRETKRDFCRSHIAEAQFRPVVALQCVPNPSSRGPGELYDLSMGLMQRLHQLFYIGQGRKDGERSHHAENPDLQRAQRVNTLRAVFGPVLPGFKGGGQDKAGD